MNTFSEVVTIFVGQTGTELSNAFWNLLCEEHQIDIDGFKRQGISSDNTYYSFFAPLQGGRFTPRTVIVDLDPWGIDKIKTGVFKNLFNPSFLIAGKGAIGKTFAYAYSTGQEIIDLTLERIRIICENCSNLNAFMIFRSLGGGTGSGFASLLFERLADDYGTKLKLDYGVYPSLNISPLKVELYNFVLTTHDTMEYKHCCFAVDKEALYDICRRKLHISDPFKHLSHLQAQTISGITTPMRFECAKSMKLQELLTNLIPYPRTHSLIISYAPIMSRREAAYSNLTVENITNESFQPTNHMLKCDPRIGDYMSCCLLYRGNVDTSAIRNSIASLKNKQSIRFLPFNPIGFTVGINYQRPIMLPDGDLGDSTRIVTNLSNNTTIRHVWDRIAHKFDLMYEQKHFVHHYINQCVDEDFFDDARANISALIEEYIEIEQ